jgi:hypothetical protein
MPGTSPGMTWGCSTARAQIHLTAKCRGCCASNRTQHALVERSIVRINRKQWSAPTSGCLAMGKGLNEGLQVSRTFHFRFRPAFSSAGARMCRRACPVPRLVRSSIRIPAFAFLKAHGCVLSCIFLFFCKHQKHAARGPHARARATKNPARHAARTPGVVSVNTLFSKILVTRVKRKIELPLGP